jgi:hypothetical protein
MSKGQSLYVQSKKLKKKMGPRKDPWKLKNKDTPHANDDFASMLDASNIN